jgi:hypothetical protein
MSSTSHQGQVRSTRGARAAVAALRREIATTERELEEWKSAIAMQDRSLDERLAAIRTRLTELQSPPSPRRRSRPRLRLVGVTD